MLRSIQLLDYAEQQPALEPGEVAINIGPTAIPPNAVQAKAHIASATGVQPPSGRCCVVVGGKVVSVINADPAIDYMPNGMLLSSDTAIIGDLYTNNAFQRRYAVVQVGTGLVTGIVYDDPRKGHSPHWIASLTLNVGDVIQIAKKKP